MQTTPLEGNLLRDAIPIICLSPIFRGLTQHQLNQVLSHGSHCRFDAGETVMEQGAPSDAFFVLLTGSVSIRVNGKNGLAIEVTTFKPVSVLGELGVLLSQPRTASAVATEPVEAVRFEAKVFAAMTQGIPAFSASLCRVLAQRVAATSNTLLVSYDEPPERPADPAAAVLLPLAVLQRFRVLPLRAEGNNVSVGFVDEPTPSALAAIRQNLPSSELKTSRIPVSVWDAALKGLAGDEQWSKPDAPDTFAPTAHPTGGSPRLDALLRRMVAEGASDLHLSGMHRPRWRIDGEIHELADAPPLGPNEVLELLRPVMDERAKMAFEKDNDADFAYALPGTARFRTNLFRDHGGVCAVLRQIPDKILSFDQLGLPPVARTLCEHPKGLVLVTGPTGSGKSTTLAAMVDIINRERRAHIITLEDPIEFVHPSRKSLVNQREVGSHTNSFARALKAALREDPDIVLVGEMRDLETVSLALETANTGHLVFGTLHTATAISTVDRIVNLFPPEQQAQVRATLGDVLKGVIAQTLCRKIGGGRVAALEILVSSLAVANLIREGKTQQIATSMSTGKALGNQTLNEELAKLVQARKVAPEEALAKAVDKGDLARRLGVLVV